MLSVTPHQSRFSLRSLLVVVQFTISIALVIVTASIDKQLSFIQNERLGFDKEHVVVIPIRDESLQRNFEAFKNRLLAQSGVVSATAISNFPWEQGYYDFPIHAEGMRDGTEWSLATLIVDHDFINTLGIEMVEGRDFAKEFVSDAGEAFILNQAAIKKLGRDSAINRKFSIDHVSSGGAREGRVIGVMQDIHMRSLHHEIEPLVLMVSPETYYLDNIAVRIAGRNIAAELSAIEQVWSELVPHRPFDSFFLGEAFDRLYRKEERLGEIFGYFTGLTIFVACLGLFGLASYTAEQRTKEIGVRKVLGASVSGIAMLLSRDFTRLVISGFVIATPVAYWFVHRWLQDFAFRAPPSAWTFIIAGGLVLGIALLTVSWQAIRAAVMNPVDTLRHE